MGTAALTLGIVGLFTWIIPPLGFAVSILGLILGIMELVLSKQQKRRAIAGIIMCIIGIILGIGILVGLVAAGWILEQFLSQYSGY